MDELSVRHREIIRMAFAGLSSVAIADQVGIRVTAVREVLKSELAQAEIARLGRMADEAVTNTPMKVRLINELNSVGLDALRVNHSLLRDEKLDPRVRAGIGRHLMDRLIFDKSEETEQTSYREILRSLDRLEKKVDLDVLEARIKPVEEPIGD
jgi:hypothetical protein